VRDGVLDRGRLADQVEDVVLLFVQVQRVTSRVRAGRLFQDAIEPGEAAGNQGPEIDALNAIED